jgi:murein DD-endopeptidase MepM/ murein hydrolase activator NlpD
MLARVRVWWASLLVFLLGAGTASAAMDEPGPELIFPLPGASRAGPGFPEGRFGAYRPGRHRRDCGRGHCGIDLCAPAGSFVVAVRAGTVEQIDRGGDGDAGGRWIRVRHADGTASWYMHLAAVKPGIKAGVAVEAGDTLATLGRTGVSTSPTHLHFALTVGKGPHERHVDPTPFLDRSQLTRAPNAPADF